MAVMPAPLSCCLPVPRGAPKPGGRGKDPGSFGSAPKPMGGSARPQGEVMQPRQRQKSNDIDPLFKSEKGNIAFSAQKDGRTEHRGARQGSGRASRPSGGLPEPRGVGQETRGVPPGPRGLCARGPVGQDARRPQARTRRPLQGGVRVAVGLGPTPLPDPRLDPLRAEPELEHSTRWHPNRDRRGGFDRLSARKRRCSPSQI